MNTKRSRKQSYLGTMLTTSVALAAYLCCGVVLTINATTADAQKARYTRDSKVKIKVEQTQYTKERKKAPKKKVQPQITADDVIEVQGKVKGLRVQQCMLLEELIGDTSEGEERADLYFRLANCYSGIARYSRYQARELDSKIYKAKTKAQKSALKANQKRRMAESDSALKRAVRSYTKLVDGSKYRNYKRMPEALFRFAIALEGDKERNPGYMKYARKIYKRLIDDYPRSKYVADAYLRFADYFFEQSSFANAEAFYDKVLKFPKSNSYNYALYKKGWVYVNLDRHREALNTFLTVARRTDNSKKEEVLNRATKKDIVRAYAEVGKAQKALQNFS